jgi:predicted MPP superfamily phosphohydrolase
VDPDYLISTMEKVSALQPDLVVLTGDFMTCEATEQVPEVARVLGHLRRPPHGILAILGNHDYARGWRRPDVAAELSDRLGRLGVTVLRNAACEVEGLTVLGVDDLWSGRLDLTPLSRELARPGAKLVLCHNPDAVDRPGWAGYRGWVLSGHTHGGQCKPPFLPPPLLPVANRRYTAGAFDLWDGRWLYVNRGLGHLRRVRFNVRPEATVFDLVPA